MSRPDVSRVEYDAALKRVRSLRAVPEPVADPDRYIVAVTLAALGLNEPPTEPKPFDVRDHPMAFPSHVDEPPTEEPLAVERAHIIERLHKIENGEYSVIEMAHDLERLARHPVWEASNKAAADVEAAYDRGRAEAVPPPTEPPKACPYCDGDATLPVADGRIECSACNGSGIDGGTADG